MVVCAPLETISTSGQCNSLDGLCKESNSEMTRRPSYLENTAVQRLKEMG